MTFKVLTLFPDMIKTGLLTGVVGQAFAHQRLNLKLINPRDFASGVHQACDDRPFGGSDGMVMTPEVLQKALSSEVDLGTLYCLTPRGRVWSDAQARQAAKDLLDTPITLLCGRYAGVDQRLIARHSMREISIGDYVLSGGEFAALVVMDSIVRHLPEVLGNPESLAQESFAEGLLEEPLFTRPRAWQGLAVPEVLLSGDHAKIKAWREDLRLLTTLNRRPDLYAKWLNAESESQKRIASAHTRLKHMSDEDFFSCGLSERETLLEQLQKSRS